MLCSKISTSLRVSVLIRTFVLSVFEDGKGKENSFHRNLQKRCVMIAASTNPEAGSKVVFMCVCFLQTLPQTVTSLLVPPRITAGILDNYAKTVSPKKTTKTHTEIPVSTHTHTKMHFLASKRPKTKSHRGLIMHVCTHIFQKEKHTQRS